MELRHLRYFVTVAEELHFGRAAKRLMMAQPPLSQQIKRLEAELGVPLFDRTRRQIRLTPQGTLLLQDARRTLVQAQAVIRLAAAAAEGEGNIGHLQVGFTSSALYGPLPGVVRGFRDMVPDILFIVEQLNSTEQLRLLTDDRLDVGFVRTPADRAGLGSFKIGEERLVVALPVGHRLTSGQALALETLASEPFILFPRTQGAGYWDLVLDACHQSGFSPSVRYEAPEIHSIVALVAMGLGVSIVPTTVQHLQIPGVRYQEIAGPPLHIPLTAVWRSGDNSVGVRRLIRYLRENQDSLAWT